VMEANYFLANNHFLTDFGLEMVMG